MGRLFAPKPKVEAAPPEPPAPPAPTGLSKDDLKTILDGAMSGVSERLAGTVSALTAKVEELASRQPQVVVQQPGQPTPHEPEGITDQDIDSAVLSGTGAAARIRQLVDRAVNAATQRVIDQRIKPLEDYGVNTLGELSRRVTAAGMPEYNRFKREIDERLGQLTPDVRANPLVIETIYNAVVGSHKDELVKEAVEAAIRQSQEPPPPTTPGTGAGPGVPRDDRDKLPDVSTYLGAAAGEGLDALKNKGTGGQDADSFARSMGYHDWASYMKQYEELLAAETAGSA